MSKCVACGKSGDNNLKACTACKLVKYCNVTCQKAHRPRHKKECKKRAAEIFDDALFKTPPPKEDCPICFLRMPLIFEEIRYRACCGKIICVGCAYANEIENPSTEFLCCPFCRAPDPTSDVEALEMIKERIEVGDTIAMNKLGCGYQHGIVNVPQDFKKALELWHRAAKLGFPESHYNIGVAYYNGEGVEKDVKKSKYHWEQGAMGGDVTARYNLGAIEWKAGNMNRAMKHFMISAGIGDDDSLKKIQNGFMCGHVTKDEFEKALRAHNKSKNETQSDQRDTARRWLDDHPRD
ncbi:hypothetical protein ACHAXR_005071 [Thalassiosira sp. AJA248-18]